MSKTIREVARELLCSLGFHTYDAQRSRTSVVLYRCRHCSHEMYQLNF